MRTFEHRLAIDPPMGFYDRQVLPRLLDFAMRSKEATRYRGAIVPLACGGVLEIGAGSGLNVPFYGPAVTRLCALDPSPAMLRMARGRHAAGRFPVEFIEGSAEEIALPDGAVDTVVTTWALCTIPDAAKALREARRVLAPGGSLLFVEHGLAPDASVERWQRRLDPLWRRVAGGCHLDRPMDSMIRESGFRIVEMQRAYASGPRPLAYMYSGRARPA